MSNDAQFQAVSIPAEESPSLPPASETARPAEMVPEKFMKDGQVDVESLAKSYKELEARLAKGQEPNKDYTPEKVDEKQAPISVPYVGPEDMDRYSKEVLEQGSLSEQSYQELRKVGYSKEVVDAYLKGLVHEGADTMSKDQLNESHIESFKQAIGGDQVYSQMSAWAAQNLSPQELRAYNDVVDSGDPAKIQLAVNGLHARYTREYGKEPNLVGGRQSESKGSQYRSMNELVEAMADPRYSKDEAYRKDVQERLMRSRII